MNATSSVETAGFASVRPCLRLQNAVDGCNERDQIIDRAVTLFVAHACAFAPPLELIKHCMLAAPSLFAWCLLWRSKPHRPEGSSAELHRSPRRHVCVSLGFSIADRSS